MDAEGEALAGGNASGAVIRIGSTVRKPWTPATPAVDEYVAFLRAGGVDAPRPMGRDAEGRRVVEYVPGRMAMDARLGIADLARAGALVRSIHDVSGGFEPPSDARWDTAIPAPGDDLVCHNDLAPWNLVVGERWVFIDWDAAAPSTRLWDLAYAAQAFALQDTSRPPEAAAAALGAFVDGYGADDDLRAALPQAMVERAAAMLHLLASGHEQGREPWGSMYVDGHGAHWTGVVRYTEAHADVWRRALERQGRSR